MFQKKLKGRKAEEKERKIFKDFTKKFGYVDKPEGGGSYEY